MEKGMRISDETQAWIIKIAAVVTSMPRWVAALLAAEGLVIPDAWAGWWLAVSAVMSACMAVVEGWAFAYVFAAWRKAQGRSSRWMAALAMLSAGVFVLVIAPYIAASVRHVAIGEMLSNDVLLWVWSGSVALSTIAIVASVGFAQKQDSPSRERVTAKREQTQADTAADASNAPATRQQKPDCECGWIAKTHPPTQGALNAHAGRCQLRSNGHKRSIPEIIERGG